RYTDPRRFGCMLWLPSGEPVHPLLINLGPEPLSEDFSGGYLHQISRKRSAAVKTFIMNGRIVVGVGNIYANEALFMAGIHPLRAAGRISKERYELLAVCIKKVLADAIELGGTTLRDFTGSDGSPGYFKQALKVYGRAGNPCKKCKEDLLEVRIGQRSTVYCKHCQH
ncbi:MAG: zinc finger domain-containing protein, partial [Gammaproteobacteria bacterium]